MFPSFPTLKFPTTYQLSRNIDIVLAKEDVWWCYSVALQGNTELFYHLILCTVCNHSQYKYCRRENLVEHHSTTKHQDTDGTIVSLCLTIYQGQTKNPDGKTLKKVKVKIEVESKRFANRYRTIKTGKPLGKMAYKICC